MYTSQQIADWILSQLNSNSGDTISPLKLQKLLYYCQAWHYTIFNEVLFDERIEAWTHGPVVPSQFKRFNNIDFYQNIKVKNFKYIKLKSKTEQLLNEVVGIYNKCTDDHLELLVKREDPWKETRGDIPEYAHSDKEITLNLMKEYYSSINK
jgi:uncharacterized phage-associated protein|nr:MAG TPA: hypothetical protein [Caudoviricetes sp.]